MVTVHGTAHRAGGHVPARPVLRAPTQVRGRFGFVVYDYMPCTCLTGLAHACAMQTGTMRAWTALRPRWQLLNARRDLGLRCMASKPKPKKEESASDVARVGVGAPRCCLPTGVIQKHQGAWRTNAASSPLVIMFPPAHPQTSTATRSTFPRPALTCVRIRPCGSRSCRPFGRNTGCTRP